MKIIFIPINMKAVYTSASIFIFLILTITSIVFYSRNTIQVSISKDQLTTDLKQMFIVRDKAALAKDTESVKSMYDTSIKLGLWAYEHEKKRTEYLNNWAIIRNAKFISMESDIKIQRVREKGGSIWVDFLHAGKFTYIS